jgi:hypothetical protein
VTERTAESDYKLPHSEYQNNGVLTPKDICNHIDEVFDKRRIDTDELSALQDALASGWCGHLGLIKSISINGKSSTSPWKYIAHVVVRHIERKYPEPFQQWLTNYEELRARNIPVMPGYEELYQRASTNGNEHE